MEPDERAAGRPGDGHDDYFVTVSATGPTGPSGARIRPSPDPPRRWPGIAVILVLALAVAATVTAALVRSTTSGSSDARSTTRTAAGPIEQDGFALWATNADGSPVRWNPCDPIRWTLNPTGAPVGAEEDLHAAIGSVAGATGLEFEFVGTTDEVPHRDRAPYQPDRYGRDRWAPVLVAWSSPPQGGLLEDRARAVAIPVGIGDGTASVFISGQIVFNRDRHLQRGFSDRTASLGGTAMHELGHLVGLDHVSDPDQLMFPHPHLGAVRWGDGDRRGLATVGADLGCVDAPAPQPVQVTYVPDFEDLRPGE